MKVGFIGQGYGIPCKSATDLFEAQNSDEDEVTTAGQAIVASLANESFHTAHFLTAFVTRSGVQKMVNAKDAVDGIENIQFYVGVDQEATTKQGLERLLQTEVETKVFRLKRSDLTYHPKVYLFKGDEKARVITGSANITEPGLLANVEAATVCDADLSNKSDREFIEDVENSLLDPVDRDATELTDSLLKKIVKNGRIGDENARSYSSTSTDQSEQNQDPELNLGATPSVSPPTLPSISQPSAVNSETPTNTESATSDDLPSRDELPPIPKRSLEDLPTDTDKRFYRRLLDEPTTQPGLIRRIIFEEGEITQGELKQRLVENHGYNDSGSVIASLRVLWRTTDEVEKKGKGSSARLIWKNE